MRVVPYGEEAVLVEVADTAEAMDLYDDLRANPPEGALDCVPAARTVLVTLRDGQDRDGAMIEVAVRRRPPRLDRTLGPLVQIEVTYDGADLAEVAELTGLSVDDVVRAHQAGDYVVAFCGFAPGFAYLTGLDERLHVPRRATPRTRVPAGAVAIAGEYSSVYPRASPGGWRLLGHTGHPLWHPDRDPPTALVPGTRVRFVSGPPTSDLTKSDLTTGELVTSELVTGELVTGESVTGESVPGELVPGELVAAELRVIASGPLTTVQDLGRFGYAALGVGSSGAADRPAAQLANRLVGNPEDAALLEITLGGFVADFPAGAVVALTGAPGELHVNGRGVGYGAAALLPAGARLDVGFAASGLRSYLAVRGGIDVAPVLGSRSTDTLSGLGPAPLRPGDVLPIGPAPDGPTPAVDFAPGHSSLRPSNAGAAAILHVDPGPRADWFTPDALSVLCRGDYTVDAASDRVGVRLSGAALTRVQTAELPSEGLVRGAVQIPASGQPLVFLADHPVTGGYPVLAVVRTADLPILAQLRPGQLIAFKPARG